MYRGSFRKLSSGGQKLRLGGGGGGGWVGITSLVLTPQVKCTGVQ